MLTKPLESLITTLSMVFILVVGFLYLILNFVSGIPTMVPLTTYGATGGYAGSPQRVVQTTTVTTSRGPNVGGGRLPPGWRKERDPSSGKCKLSNQLFL